MVHSGLRAGRCPLCVVVPTVNRKNGHARWVGVEGIFATLERLWQDRAGE
eukprot:SAG11_NODE_35009_length_268_cov_94.189349_1_plen_49_part_10